MKTALLLSGGMDSLSLAWWKRPDFAITVNYGQLAADAELEASSAICKRLDIQHEIIHVDCHHLGSGDMAGAAVNPYAPESDWWPYRNQLLITLAAMRAICLGASTLWIGTVQSDAAHKDGSLDFVNAMAHLLAIQEGQLLIEAPAITMSTVELILHSGIPSSVLAWSHSCHKANVMCGNCRGCNKYLEVFGELGYELDRSR